MRIRPCAAATNAIFAGDTIASLLCAVATGVACVGLRGDRVWAYRLGQGLAWCYVACNTAAAVACAGLMPDWPILTAPFGLYVASLAVAILAVGQLRAHRRSATTVGITSLRRLTARHASAPSSALDNV